MTQCEEEFAAEREERYKFHLQEFLEGKDQIFLVVL